MDSFKSFKYAAQFSHNLCNLAVRAEPALRHVADTLAVSVIFCTAFMPGISLCGGPV